MNSLFKPTFVALGLALTLIPSQSRAGEFVVDQSKSSIQVDVKATGHGFTAKLNAYKVKITGDSSKALPSKVKVTWDFKDLLTGDKKRDVEMLHWMDHAKLPSGSFELVDFTKRVDGNMWAKGTLKFHGVSQTVQFPVASARKGDALTVSGSVQIDHRNFKLSKIRKVLVFTVDPVVTVRFKLQGTIK